MQRYVGLSLVLALSLSLAGCELVGDILEFGLWVVLILLALVIALVVWIFRKVF